MSESYKPISCETHSQYELAIIRIQELDITWQQQTGESITETLKPYDVITRQNSEYLLAHDAYGKDKKIRLDKIIEAHSII